MKTSFWYKPGIPPSSTIGVFTPAFSRTHRGQAKKVTVAVVCCKFLHLKCLK